ncbi:MAG TPA: MFS transporter, partial [Polyangiaceae bacterium]|nr:MFS transporter [Polyangiaceae bacterium]
MRHPMLLLLLAYLAFVSLGLPDTALGVAWPSLRRHFDLPASAIATVLTAGMAGYFTSGLLAGKLMQALGVGGVLALSCGFVTAALTVYALAPAWWFFFPGGLLMGIGSGAIDAGLNGYAARHFSVKHVNWLHACWGIGASVGPALMTGAIARGNGYTAGYGLLALALGGMTVAFAWTHRLWNEPAGEVRTARSTEAQADAAVQAHAEVSAAGDGPRVTMFAALRSGPVWLHIVAFFLYTGFEASTGQWCFTLLTAGRGLSVERAGFWTSCYWGSLTLGRVLLGFVVDRFGPDRLLRYATTSAALGAAAWALDPGLVGRLGLLLVGLSLAPIFPTLMARTPARLG